MVSVAEASGDHADGDARKEQRGRVQVAQIVHPGVRQRFGRGSGRLVVPVDQIHPRRVDQADDITASDRTIFLTASILARPLDRTVDHCSAHPQPLFAFFFEHMNDWRLP
jgi:hypothetical protein